jgi:hypothetical protein
MPVDGKSVHDFKAVFLDDRICEDFAGNFFQLLLGFVAGPAVEFEDEEFALANVADGGVTETGKGMVNRLALRIENGLLWHNPNVSFHGKSIAGWKRR